MVVQIHHLYIQSFVVLLFALGGCRSGSRVLSEEERLAHGLNGVIYDAPLCPMILDKKTQISQVNGECETVTCLPNGQTFRCTARKR